MNKIFEKYGDHKVQLTKYMGENINDYTAEFTLEELYQTFRDRMKEDDLDNV